MHPKSNVMRIYIKHKYVGQVLISGEEYCAAESKSIDHHLATSDEMLLKVVASLEKLDKDKIENKNYYKERIKREKIDKFRCMQLHGQFGRDTDDKKSAESWNWLKHRNLKIETGSLLSAAWEQALNNNSIRKIYHKDVSHKC